MLEHIKSDGVSVDEKKFIDLIEFQEPRFLLVINDRPKWYEEYVRSELEFDYIEMKLFKNEQLETLYSISGDSLSIAEKKSIINPSRNGQFFELSASSLLSEFKENRRIAASYKNQDFEFSVVNSKKQCLLWPFPDGILNFKYSYQISKPDDTEKYHVIKL